MLIHHFGTKTQGFQGLVDQNGKTQEPDVVVCKSSKQFLFLMSLDENQYKPAFAEIHQNILKYDWS